MNNRKVLNFLLGTIILVSVVPAYSKVRFDDVDLNADGKLLYVAEQKTPGMPDCRNLYSVSLGDDKATSSPSLLTCFPERMELLNEGKTIQVRNAHGTYHYNFENGQIKVISDEKNARKKSRTFTATASSDGKWYCYVEPVKKATGNLVLVHSKTLLKKTVVEDVELDYSSISVKWAPDGKAFLYESKGNVYFATPDSIFKNLQVSENFRRIGEGTIDCVQWTQNRKIIYLKKDTVYSIDQNELYTRGLYSGLVGNGDILGRLPAEFDSVKDNFWCSPLGKKIAVISGKNLLSVYSIPEKEASHYLKTDFVYSLSEISGTCIGYKVFWNAEKYPLLWMDNIDFETSYRSSSLYSVNDGMNPVLQADSSIVPVCSPDLKRFAYSHKGEIKVFELSSGKQISFNNPESVVSVIWTGKKTFVAGGMYTASHYNVSTYEKKILFLSSVDKAFWNGNMIVARSRYEKNSFIYDPNSNNWKISNASYENSDHSDKNGSYRVFLGKSSNPECENTIYVRCLSDKTVTYSVIPESFGSDMQAGKVSLVFDAVENADGLGNILGTLAEYGIKGTFFINGEFIRRYPQETKLIANSGCDCGSLFYTPADLVENNFIVDKDFVVRGLARNEDEFFSLTKKELSLVWHAPNYHDTKLIKDAGTSAGYEYVSAFTKYSDRIDFENSLAGKGEYKNVSEIIDGICEELHDGMVIPVAVGKTAGTRKDYLYEKLDLLISSILESGYTITELENLK